MNNKNKQFVFGLFSVILLLMIVMASGIIYRYYDNKQKNESDIKVVVKNVSLLMSYDNKSSIYFKNLNSKIDYDYNFSISNSSYEYPVNYELEFEIENSPFVVENSEFTYSLNGEVLSKNDNDKLISINGNVPTETVSLGTATITGNQVHYYKLNIKYDAQSNNNLFVGKIVIKKAIE